MNLALKIETSDPVHVQIERYFRREIQGGRLAAGYAFPSTPDLARRWGVSYSVVQKALFRAVRSSPRTLYR